MSKHPPRPERTGLVAIVDQRVQAAWIDRRACQVEVSPEEWQAVAEWSLAWHRWYRHGRSARVSLRIRNGQREQWWEDDGWRPIGLGIDGCMLVRVERQGGLF